MNDTLRHSILLIEDEPFIIVSGHSQHILPARFQDQPFLQKPYRMEALVRMVREMLEAADARSVFKAV